MRHGEKMQIYIRGTGLLVGNVVGRYMDIENMAGFIDNDKSQKEWC